jgi:hypothetical protein
MDTHLSFLIFMQRIIWIVFFTGIVFPGIGQTIITGKVLDESSSFPLQGATIIAKGVTGVRQTDENGIFRIEVPDTIDVLIVSCTGFVDKEVSITGIEWMDVRLQRPCFFNEAAITQGGKRYMPTPVVGFDD